MKLPKIFGIMMAMILLVTTLVSAVPPTDPLEFSEGLTLTLDTIDEHPINTDLALYSGIYDTKTGLRQDNTTICSADILFIQDETIEIVYAEEDFTYEQNIIVINGSVFNNTGTYKAEFWCQDALGTKGGYTSETFEVAEETTFGLWKPVDDWTFPVIYLILTFILIGVALAYESALFGVLGSIMLIMSYFIVGATSPVLFAPLLIVGFLLAFKFATL